ncbi:hypothetical protein AB1286_21625 [Trinickia sp. NRRL B-1857]|uniref:hypothetical protein n=1 Tax=Trinickia sp. NRRL B-1857 TaxID=3162879 RepID=UPI003D2AF25B
MRKRQKSSPLPRRQIVETLLAAHLSLVACRTGRGSKHLLFELVHATYLSYILWTQGYGEAEHAIFSAAEARLDNAARHGYETDSWIIEPDTEDALRPVLAVYDRQVSTVSIAVLIEAKGKLRQLFAREGARQETHSVAA